MTTWVEIDTAALADNARRVRALLGPATQLCAVVKANGYGHGAVLAAQAFVEGGAQWLAVTSVAEAVELREAGFSQPLLLLTSCLPDEADEVVARGLIATVSALPTAAALSSAAERRGVRAAVHLLVDTGMGRDGVLPEEAAALYAQLAELPALSVDGVFTHFPNSIAADKAPTRAQLARFLATVARLAPRPRWVHAANSGAAVDVPEARLDLARVGTLLYGQSPSRQVGRVEGLRQGWALKSRLIEVRRLPAGATIGYGSEYRLPAERLVGTLAVGWQHGFAVLPESLASGWRGAVNAWRRRPPTVTIKGVTCPVIGRISMQTCCVDVTAVSEVAVGDVADVPARRVTCDRGLRRVAVGA